MKGVRGSDEGKSEEASCAGQPVCREVEGRRLWEQVLRKEMIACKSNMFDV